jgi:hypothetical protein
MDAHALKLRRQGRQAVALFVTQMGDVGEDRPSRSPGGQDGQGGNHVGHVVQIEALFSDPERAPGQLDPVLSPNDCAPQLFQEVHHRSRPVGSEMEMFHPYPFPRQHGCQKKYEAEETSPSTA